MIAPPFVPGYYYRQGFYGAEPVEENPCKDLDPEDPESLTEECAATWNGADYYNWLLYLKSILSEEDYESLQEAFLNWKSLNKATWRYNNAWKDVTVSLLCILDSSKSECQNGLFQRISDWIDFQQDESLWYSFSRDESWLTTVTDIICAGFGGESR